ncbi:rod shape-determining protein MreC [Paenibacillus sp. MWE-103]|uniref:Cell shape-determining protein MreC n=1 Tax=Paenibacillus artemisiicola TaxID=1172618 RepID=A0ABS3W7P4_9BACL|nr:rod shape-determining protein MreC [Paenibacillus artemisiicola]MBO7744336.1 rod shape-determining protein MreC [Paenibacillus artemisiicola]
MASLIGVVGAALVGAAYRAELMAYVANTHQGLSALYATYQENKQLKKIANQAGIRAIRMWQTETDIAELNKAKAAKKQLPATYAYKVARIADAGADTIQLDLGSLDGVKQNDAVLSLDQYFVGMVTAVEKHSATVGLLNTESYMTNKGIAIRATNKASTFGIAEYDANAERLAIKKIPPDALIKKGDVIETLGGDTSRYRPGLKIGTVAGIEVSPMGLSSEATLEIPEFPTSHDVFVFIIAGP